MKKIFFLNRAYRIVYFKEYFVKHLLLLFSIILFMLFCILKTDLYHKISYFISYIVCNCILRYFINDIPMIKNDNGFFYVNLQFYNSINTKLMVYIFIVTIIIIFILRKYIDKPITYLIMLNMLIVMISCIYAIIYKKNPYSIEDISLFFLKIQIALIIIYFIVSIFISIIIPTALLYKIFFLLLAAIGQFIFSIGRYIILLLLLYLNLIPFVALIILIYNPVIDYVFYLNAFTWILYKGSTKQKDDMWKWLKQ